MALRRSGKIWLIVIGCLLLLLVAAAVTLKVMFTSDKLKAMVIPRIEAATHRTVTVDRMNLALLPSLALEIEGFRMSNATGEGFSPEPFLDFNTLVLDVRLLPLLKGNVEVSTVRLERPRLLIEVNPRGVSNYADLTRVADTAAAPGPGETGKKQGGMGILVPDLRITDGTLRYVDRKGNSAMTVDGLQQTMKLDFRQEERKATVEGQTTIGSFSYGTLTTPLISGLRMSYKERILYLGAADSLVIEENPFTLQEMTMMAGGVATRLSGRPFIDITVHSDKINIAELFSLIPKEYMKKAEGLKGSGVAKATIHVVGEVADSTIPDISGQVSTTDASLQYARLPKPISHITILADFVRGTTRQEFRVQRFTATLGDNPISATMQVVNFTDPTLAMTINGSMNLADVNQYYPLEQGTELSGAVTANVQLSGKVSAPMAMKASGTMEFRGVTAKAPTSKNPVRNVQGTVTFNNQLIEAKSVSLNLGRSDLTLGFWMKNYLSMMSTDPKAPKPTANLTLRSTHLYTADVMTEPPPQDTTQRPARQAPAAPQQKKKQAMALPNIDMDIAATIGTLTMEKFEFTNVRAAMKAANGVITLQNFAVNAFGGSVTTRGSLNLQKPEQPLFDLALDMNNLDAHAVLPKFTSFGERLFGRMTMTTSMKGALNDTLGLVPNTLSGQGRVQVNDGKLTGFKVNQAIASLLKLPDLETITFKDWTNTFTIANGRAIIKDLKIHALDADYVANGSQGLMDGTMDYTMSLLLPEKTSSRVTIGGLGGQAVNLLKDESGRVKLDFAVGGTTSDPKVSLDTQAAQRKAEQMAKQKVADEAKKAGEKVKEKAGDVLKNIFKKK